MWAYLLIKTIFFHPSNLPNHFSTIRSHSHKFKPGFPPGGRTQNFIGQLHSWQPNLAAKPFSLVSCALIQKSFSRHQDTLGAIFFSHLLTKSESNAFIDTITKHGNLEIQGHTSNNGKNNLRNDQWTYMSSESVKYAICADWRSIISLTYSNQMSIFKIVVIKYSRRKGIPEAIELYGIKRHDMNRRCLRVAFYFSRDTHSN